MGERTQEKVGWIGGWLGGFVWVLIMAMIFLFQGKWVYGAMGTGLFGVASLSIVSAAPWRYPSTHYWKLMCVPYACFILAVGWAVWAHGGYSALGLNWWNLLWLLPMFLPFGLLSRKKWTDGEAGPEDSGEVNGSRR